MSAIRKRYRDIIPPYMPVLMPMPGISSPILPIMVPIMVPIKRARTTNIPVNIKPIIAIKLAHLAVSCRKDLMSPLIFRILEKSLSKG